MMMTLHTRLMVRSAALAARLEPWAAYRGIILRDARKGALLRMRAGEYRTHLMVRSTALAARLEPCATHRGFILRDAAKTPLLRMRHKGV
jgi:hypothetical protein